MRGLARLIYRYHVFLVFVVLEMIAFAFLTRYNSYHSTAFLNSTNGLATTIYSQQARVQQLLKLQEANDSLALELAMMKSRESDFYHFYGEDFNEMTDSLKQQQYRFVSSRVVNSSVNRASNYMSINKGTSSGIKPEMAVIANNSLVGLVKDVSESFSSVMPLINSNFKASVKLKDKGNFGVVRWMVGSVNTGLVEQIPTQAKVEVGDTIVTSGYSSYFPPNIMVGTVEEAIIEDGDSFYTIKIKLSTDFSKVQYVEVIENLLREEQVELEDTQDSDNDR